MKLHQKREIAYMGTEGYLATCTCLHQNGGKSWGEAEVAIESHIDEENRILRLNVANTIFQLAEPGRGHVGNHVGDGTFERYETIADYVLAKGFDLDA